MNEKKKFFEDQKTVRIISLVLIAIGFALSIAMVIMSYASSAHLTLYGITHAWWAYLVLMVVGVALALEARLNGFKKEMILSLIGAAGIIQYLVMIVLGLMIQGLIGFAEAVL